MPVTETLMERLPAQAGMQYLPGSFRKRLGFANPPSAVTLYLTERCNLHCHMCPHGEGTELEPGPRSNPAMLSMDLLDRLYEELLPHRPEIALMGGEPMIHPQCTEVIARASRKGLRVNMVSNGTLLERKAEELVRAGLHNINLSLDGTADIHDQIRGQKGTFDRAVRGIQACRDAMARGAGEAPEFHIFCIIMGENHGRLVEFLESLIPYQPAHVQLNHLRFFTKSEIKEHSRYFEELFGEPNDEPAGYQKELHEIGVDVKVLQDQLRAIQEREWPFSVGINPLHESSELDDYYLTSFFERKGLRPCHAIWNYACVGPTGEVYPCLHNICGNLQEQTFMSIWNGPKWRRFRREVDRVERMPACHRCCY